MSHLLKMFILLQYSKKKSINVTHAYGHYTLQLGLSQISLSLKTGHPCQCNMVHHVTSWPSSINHISAESQMANISKLNSSIKSLVIWFNAVPTCAQKCKYKQLFTLPADSPTLLSPINLVHDRLLCRPGILLSVDLSITSTSTMYEAW